ncbi:MAG TPA: fumarate/nitrate reduction transcriptional regulator Fnr [Burkholderiaceae bacterium]|nr:fumarate/nitrate reduction transcriptional regulator Fnr [Burkholderiaceae bacterium]
MCSSCSLKGLCLPAGLEAGAMKRLGELISCRRRIRRGDSLFTAGAPFRSIYAIRSGSLKSCVYSEDGQEQITGFPMAGELVGLDGIAHGQHVINAVALEDTEVCVIGFSMLEEIAGQVPQLQRQLHRLMSREIVGDRQFMMVLGTMRADQRVAAFLLNLSRRFESRGYSAAEFHLRMTRREIGNYLGIELETVSRTLSRLDDAGCIAVDAKLVRILDRSALVGLLAEPAR